MTQVQKYPDTGTNREGFALVTTLLVVLVLSVMAVGVAWLASSEKKTTFAEGVHVRSVFAADAGAESAINFIRLSDSPPRILDFGNMEVRDQGSTNLDPNHTFSYDCRYVSKRPKAGWGMEYKDYDYRVGSEGTASAKGESRVQVVVSRLFKEGY